MKRVALGLAVVVGLSAGGFGCGGGAAHNDGGGGHGGGAAGGAAGGRGGTGGGAGASAGAGGGGSGGGGTTGAGGATAGAGGGGIGGASGAGGSAGGASSGTGGEAGRGGSSGATAGTGGNAGTGGGGATCDGTAPCGGNLVGTWSFVSVCLNEMALMEGFLDPNCPETTITNFSATVTGSVVFTATDYAVAEALSAAYTVTMPASCIQSGAPCSDFGDSLAAAASVQSAYCTGDTVCVCPIVFRPMSGSESGTYTSAGSTLNLSPTGGTPSSAGYCVQGDELHLLNIETITDMGVTKMRTRSDQVARRQ